MASNQNHEPVFATTRPRWILPVSLAGLVLALFLGVFLRQNRTSHAVIKETKVRDTAVRLTDDPHDDSHPRWTNDGRVGHRAR